MDKSAKEVLEELLLQKIGEPISDNPPQHLEFKDVHNATRIKIVVTETLTALKGLLPEGKTINLHKLISGIETNEDANKGSIELAKATGYNNCLTDCQKALGE